MLAIPLEKLAYIIIKAREYDAEVPAADGYSIEDYEIGRL
jgi:hypothetical protein